MSSLTSARHRRAQVLVAVAAPLFLVATGCSSGPASVLTGKSPAASSSGGASASASPTRTVQALPADVTRVSSDRAPVMEIERVPGLTWHTKGTQSFNRASFFTVPGADPLNGLLSAQTDAALAAFGSTPSGLGDPRGLHLSTPAAPPASALGPAPKPARSQLDVTSTLVTVGPDVIGARVSEFASMPAGETLRFRSFYYDGVAKTAVGASDLFADDAARSAWAAAVRKHLATGPGVDPAAAAAVPDPATWESVVFRSDGSAVAELSQGVLPGLGSVAVPVTSDLVKPWLSPLGRRAQKASLTPGTFPAGVELPAGSKPAVDGYGTSSATPARVNCAVEKCVALTFDDGPVPDTSRLLDMLGQRDAKATFFVVGTMAKYRPELLRRELAEGHEVGNHSMSHGQMSRMSGEKLESEVATNDQIVKDGTGTKPTLMRPPYGAFNDTVNRKLAEHGLQNIIWDVDTSDWSTHNADASVAMVDNAVQPGSIVLMHDIHPQSVDAVPRIIDVLTARGYKLVTVSELLAGTNPQPGQTISYRPGSFASTDRSAG